MDALHLWERTFEQLEQKFIGREVDEDRLNYYFTMMGRFGKSSMYTFSFHTEGYTISADVCVEQGRITGIVPEKEPREDEWGRVPDPGPADIQPEEYESMAMYFQSVVI